MNWYKLKQELTLSNFGPFVGTHTVTLPENGLVLIKGRVSETGDGSGAGKSFFLNSIPFVFGGCPFGATDLQSWYTEEPPAVKTGIVTSDTEYLIGRKDGLTIKKLGDKTAIKGKVANAELDNIFRMDGKTRALVTYRGQRSFGAFLSMSDPEKKAFLTKLLELDRFEKVEKAAKEAIDALHSEYNTKFNELQIAAFGASASETDYNEDFRKLEESKVDSFDLGALESEKEAKGKQIENINSQVKNITKNIEQLRKNNSNELEAVLATIKAKISGINQQETPLEIIAIKNELEKQQKRLEKCRQYDNDQKLAVQKQRGDLRVKINQTNSDYNEKLASNLADIRNQLGAVQLEIQKLTPSRQTLQQLEIEEKQLRDSLCPRCERLWDKAKVDLDKVIESQQREREKVAKLGVLQVESSKLKESAQKLTEDIKNEQKQAVTALENELLQIKDPEPHPVGAQISHRIGELSASIKEHEAKFRSDKQQKLDLLFKEEKAIRQDFANNLNVDLTKEQEVINSLQSQKDLLNKELIEINSKIANHNTQKLLYQDRLATFNNTKIRLAKAQEEEKKKRQALDDISKKLDMESDIIALVGRTGFLGAIFQDVLDEISGQASDILGQVANVRHLSINFETEKEAASSGNIITRITPVIYNRGRKVTFEAGISGGMQAAVELAVDLSVGNVVSSRRGSYPGWMVLDESLHGLGGVAKESCIEMLQSVAGERLVLVVDHSEQFCSLFNQVIEIEQIDGQSRIIA